MTCETLETALALGEPLPPGTDAHLRACPQCALAARIVRLSAQPPSAAPLPLLAALLLAAGLLIAFTQAPPAADPFAQVFSEAFSDPLALDDLGLAEFDDL